MLRVVLDSKASSLHRGRERPLGQEEEEEEEEEEGVGGGEEALEMHVL